WRIAPPESSFRSVPAPKAVTQTFEPSKRAPRSWKEKPAVTVVTVHGMEAPGVTIDTEPPLARLAVQMRCPSKTASSGRPPGWLATVVPPPAGSRDPTGNRFHGQGA